MKDKLYCQLAELGFTKIADDFLRAYEELELMELVRGKDNGTKAIKEALIKSAESIIAQARSFENGG